MRNKVKISVAICAMAGLVACGGGGSSDETGNIGGSGTSGCYQVMSYTKDLGTDGDFDAKSTFAYDTNGSVTHVYYDDYSSGNNDANITYRYEGKTLYEDIDSDVDGVIDENRVYKYNDDWQRIFISYAENGNDPHLIIHNMYNEDGNLEKITVDGGYYESKTIIYTYDEHGYLIKRYDEYEVDTGHNYLVKYTNNSYGNKIKEEIYWDLDDESDADEDTLSLIFTYTYDSDQNILTKQEQIFYFLITYTYDAQGNRLTEEYDNDIDANIDFKRTFTYDENNNLISKSEDNNVSDDIIDNTSYLTWKKFSNCPPSPFFQYLYWN